MLQVDFNTMATAATGGPESPQPRVRCQTEQRHRRLHRILERETLKSPVASVLVRGVKSLPSLLLSPTPTQPCPSPVLTKRTPNLSPLRTQRQRPHTRQATVITSRLKEPPPACDHDQETTCREEAAEITVERSTNEQIALEAARAREAEEWEKRRARLVAKKYKAAQLDQIQAKQQRRQERKLDAQQVAEQLEWEQTQLDLLAIARQVSKAHELHDIQEKNLHILEVERRRASAARISQHFFDQLAVLEPAQEALQMLQTKQHELVRGCMELMVGYAEPDEIEAFKEEIRESLQREEHVLRQRVRAEHRETEMEAEKKRMLFELKRTHADEIQRHIIVTRDAKAQEKTLRVEVDRQHGVHERRYQAMKQKKKQRDLDLGAKLQEQIRTNRAEQATVLLQVDGKSSPVLWTPYWNDDSVTARAETFHRESIVTGASSPPSPERHVIFAKKACQWYD